MRLKEKKLFMFFTIFVLVYSLSGCQSTTELTPSPVPEVEATSEITQPSNTPQPTLLRPTEAPVLTEEPETPTPSPTPTSVATEAPTETEEQVAQTPTVEATEEPTEQPSPTSKLVVLPTSPQIIKTNALEILPNVDPGPPFTIDVSANHLLQGYRHRISGMITNESTETYAGLNLIATFFMENGKRYGPVTTNVECLLLAPGSSCPFIVEATSKNLTSVILHTTGYPSPRTPLAPEYWGVQYRIDNIGFVHITGIVRNQYTIPARHVTVVGSLVNAEGEIVNVGTTILLDAISPDGTATFEIILKYAPFRSISITTQGEP